MSPHWHQRGGRGCDLLRVAVGCNLLRMPKVDGSYLIARTLKEEGVDSLFYLMGGAEL